MQWNLFSLEIYKKLSTKLNHLNDKKLVQIPDTQCTIDIRVAELLNKLFNLVKH